MPVFVRGETKLLFIHIPKTGGTYIEDLFRANNFQVHFWKPKRLLPIEAISPQHYHATILASIFELETIDGIFASVRHPFDRLISEYRMREPDSQTPFEKWANENIDNASLNRTHLDNHLRPQSEFLLPNTHIFRQEDGFDTAFAGNLEQIMNLSLNHKSVPRRRDNRRWHSEHAHTLSVTDGLKSKIIDFYAADFDRLDYPRTVTA